MRYSQLKYCGAQIGAVAFVAVACVVVLWILPRDMIVAKGAVLAGASVIGILVGLSAYRNADEVILHTHKTAWFWGSMAAYVVITPLMIAVMLGTMPVPALLPFPHKTPADWFTEGVIVMILVQCAGFVVFWAYHNLGRRG